jgi:hypothetical protein
MRANKIEGTPSVLGQSDRRRSDKDEAPAETSGRNRS